MVELLDPTVIDDDEKSAAGDLPTFPIRLGVLAADLDPLQIPSEFLLVSSSLLLLLLALLLLL